MQSSPFMQKRRFAGVVGLVLVASTAQAQDNAALGRYPMGSSASITPAVVVVGGYDTNFVRATDGEGASEFYVSPQVDTFFGRGRSKVTISGALEAQKVQEGNTLNHFGSANGEFGNALVQLSGGASYRNHFAPPTDFVGFEIGLKSRRVERDFLTALSFSPGRVRLSADAAYLQLRYDADASYQGSSLHDNLNRNTLWLNGNAEWAVTSLTSVTANVGHVEDKFLYAPIRDGNGWRALAGVQFSSLALINGYARLGVLKYGGRISRLSYTGPAHMVGLQYARRTLFLDLQANRDIRFSFDPTRGFYLSNGVDFYGMLKMGRRFETFARASTRTVEPRGPAALTEPKRRIWVAKGGLVYRLSQFTRFGTEVERYVYGGEGGFEGTRMTGFLIWGPENLQRLDRPLPGQF